jgi:hypothetical protein
MIKHCCEAKKNTRNCKPRRFLFRTFLNKRKKKKRTRTYSYHFKLLINPNLQVHIGLIPFEKKNKKNSKKFKRNIFLYFHLCETIYFHLYYNIFWLLQYINHFFSFLNEQMCSKLQIFLLWAKSKNYKYHLYSNFQQHLKK